GFAASDLVDVYDSSTRLWSTTKLSEPRWGVAVAAAGGRVLFAGGRDRIESNLVDVYDPATGSWSSSQLAVPRQQATGVGIDQRVLFAGGGTDAVEVFDVRSGQWTIRGLSGSRQSVR